MAIGANTAGAWAAVNATTQTVTLPTHAAGNMLVLVAACKSAAITSADPTITTPATGWTRIATFADGTTNSGVGVGSVRQAIFIRIAASSSETNPVVTWATTSTPGIAVANSFSKGAGEVWHLPVAVQAATNNATSISVTMGSNPGITAGDWGIAIHTTRDDSALTVPTWTATSATLAAVVVFPTTPIASGTSDDMAGTAAYRSVTSGTASAAPVVTGTQAAAETGVTAFVRLRVATADPQTVTPTTLAATLTTFAPTVTIPNHQLVTPTTLSLATATFAPTVSAPFLATPAAVSLALSTFAPTVAVATTVTPATAGLTLTALAPAVSAPATVAPGVADLALATFAPTVTATAHQSVTPDVASVALTTFAPDVTGGTGLTVVPTALSLGMTAFAPNVVLTDHKTVTPDPASLAMTAFAPGAVFTDHRLVTPSTADLALSPFAPTVVADIREGLAASMHMRTVHPGIQVSAASQAPRITGSRRVG